MKAKQQQELVKVGRTAKPDYVLFDTESEARHEYLHGACHSLTIALHKLTKWPCVVFFDERDPFPVPSAVRRSDGMYVDAAGAVAGKQIERRYGLKRARVADVAPGRIDAIYGGYDEWEMKDARVYARKLLAKLGSSLQRT
jgi:hypothetical protein